MKLRAETSSTGIKDKRNEIDSEELVQSGSLFIARTSTELIALNSASKEPLWRVKLAFGDRTKPYGDRPFTNTAGSTVWISEDNSTVVALCRFKHGFTIHAFDAATGSPRWDRTWLPKLHDGWGMERDIDGSWYQSIAFAWFGSPRDRVFLGFNAEALADRGQDIDGEAWIEVIDPMTGHTLARAEVPPPALSVTERDDLSVFIDRCDVHSFDAESNRWNVTARLSHEPYQWVLRGDQLITHTNPDYSPECFLELWDHRTGKRSVSRTVTVPGRQAPDLVCESDLAYLAPVAGGRNLLDDQLLPTTLDIGRAKPHSIRKLGTDFVLLSRPYLWTCNASDGSLVHTSRGVRPVPSTLPDESQDRFVLAVAGTSLPSVLWGVDPSTGRIARVPMRPSLLLDCWNGHQGFAWRLNPYGTERPELFWFRVNPD